MPKLADRAKILEIPKKVEGVTELPDGRVTSSPRETKIFRGLDDDFGLKRPNHHLGPEYVCRRLIDCYCINVVFAMFGYSLNL